MRKEIAQKGLPPYIVLQTVPCGMADKLPLDREALAVKVWAREN